MKKSNTANCINQRPRIIDERQKMPNTQNEPVLVSQGEVGEAVAEVY